MMENPKDKAPIEYNIKPSTITDMHRAAAAGRYPPPEEKRPSSQFLWYGLVLLLALPIGYCLNRPRTLAERCNDMAYEVYQFVDPRLKAPRSSHYGPPTEHFDPETQTCTVINYVDAQNSFGATVRTPFIVEMRPSDSRGERWYLVKLNI